MQQASLIDKWENIKHRTLGVGQCRDMTFVQMINNCDGRRRLRLLSKCNYDTIPLETVNNIQISIAFYEYQKLQFELSLR